MADIKMPNFRSDAVFDGNVEVKQIVKSKQIAEQHYAFQSVKCAFVRASGSATDKKAEQTPIFCKITIPEDKPSPYNYLAITSKNISNYVVFYGTEQIEIDRVGSVAWNEEDKSYSIFFIAKNKLLDEYEYYKGFSINFDLTYDALTENWSFYNTPVLYGEYGSLRRIQKNLENLESNFKQIGYSNQSEKVSIVNNNLVMNISSGDLILKQSEYKKDGVIITNIKNILQDINSRLEALEV